MSKFLGEVYEFCYGWNTPFRRVHTDLIAGYDVVPFGENFGYWEAMFDFSFSLGNGWCCVTLISDE